MPSARSPLEGLLVVAVEQAVAAPFCTSRLADAGARVVKIERPEGDFARGYDDVARGQSSYFVWLNRGKESLVVDLASPAGKETLRDLVARADVLVQNLKPGALARLGFGPEELRERYPRLICCSISGYGETGPLAERKAYDLLIQAESGLSSITGGPDEPARVGISIVDIATGATAHAAILEALIARGITGEGADIRISMFDVMADWSTVPLLQQEGDRPPKRLGLAHPSIAPYGVFTTREGNRILISIQSDREWAKFCAEFLGQPELATEARFARNVERVHNRTETDGIVAAAFARFDVAQARKRSCAPTSPSRRSTTWPRCRRTRICAGSQSRPKRDRSPCPRRPPSSRASRAVTAPFRRWANTPHRKRKPQEAPHRDRRGSGEARHRASARLDRA